MPVEKYLVGSQTTLLSTGLNSLASNSLAISAAYDNTVGGGAGDGYTECDLELVVAFGTGATVGAVSVWFVGTQDGTNYEDGGTSFTPARAPDAVIPITYSSTSAQRIIRRVMMPAGVFKALLKNDATAQAFSASGNTLKLRPITRQGV